MAKAKEVGPALAAASAAWQKSLHPRLSEEESCAFLRRVFPNSRHHCRASECPRQCPRHPDFGEPPPPPAWSSPIPAMTADEVLAAERGLAPLRRLDPPVDEEPPDDPSGPACLMCGDDERPCSWCDKPVGAAAPTTPTPAPSVPELSPPAVVREDISRTSAPYPPCSGCGTIRPIMIVMRGTDTKPAGTLCSRCYRGEPVPA